MHDGVTYSGYADHDLYVMYPDNGSATRNGKGYRCCRAFESFLRREIAQDLPDERLA
jgi:hypothetical protein